MMRAMTYPLSPSEFLYPAHADGCERIGISRGSGHTVPGRRDPDRKPFFARQR